ncbi:MAG TPA: PAS domain-containing sensor histidine kinase [Chitinophagales bacterium]|nr:PAS domain-containing sensor histidine kinase [Chitinophagales bacterium]
MKSIKEVFEADDRLNRENSEFQQQLLGAKESIDAIKRENIDALVIADNRDLKVFTEETADKIYRLLIERMNEGAIILHADGTILYSNSYFANMVNLPLQKVIGIKLINFINDSFKERFEALLKKATENAAREEMYIYRNDGVAIPVQMSANNLLLGNSLVLSIILTDLTIQYKNQEELKVRTRQLEQKNVELENANKELAVQIKEKEKRGEELSIANTDVKELEELNNHKETILAILSHDLRSPLNGIIGIAEHLKSYFDTMEDDEIKMMLDTLYKSSRDELNMLDYLLDWARIKYASEVFSPAKVDLFQYVNKVFDTLNETVIARNINLYNEVEENIGVYADGKMLLSILQNIVSNAIKHTPSGGKVTVTAKRKGDKIITAITDTGMGMSKQVQEKLFTPQRDLLSKARKENKGAGIGLLLVKGFLEKNDGEIWVESVEGEGASFYFALPADKPLDKAESKDKTGS